MTESEAIKGIDTLKDMCKYKYECGTCDICYKAVPIATQALEKQIPKKHIDCKFSKIKDAVGWCCPSCGNELYWYTDYGQQKFNYCIECGQKLDWSE